MPAVRILVRPNTVNNGSAGGPHATRFRDVCNVGKPWGRLALPALVKQRAVPAGHQAGGRKPTQARASRPKFELAARGGTAM
jgi:hypothetical protein